MIQAVLSIDSAISLLLADIVPHTIGSDLIFSFLSLQGNFIFIWIAILTALFVYGKIKQVRTAVFLFVLSLMIGHILVDYVLKPAFERPRPYIVHNIDSLVCPQTFSFPSGHATGAFAGATILAYFDKKRRVWYYNLATLISYSRIYLYCHFLLDVLSGALLGYIISRLTLYHMSYSTKKRLTHKI